MAKGEVVFIFFALSVLFAGWLWLQDPTQDVLPSWEEWLYNNGLKGVEIDLKEHGISSLHLLIEKAINPQDMEYLSHAQRDKLKQVMPKLKLLVWLDKKGLYSFHQILADEGYTDLQSLAEMDIEPVMVLAEHVRNLNRHQNLLHALDELRKEAKAKAADQDFDDSTSQTGMLWSILKVILWVVTIVLVCLFLAVVIVLVLIGLFVLSLLEALGRWLSGKSNSAPQYRSRSDWLSKFFNFLRNNRTVCQSSLPQRQSRKSEALFQPGMLARLTGRFLDVSKCEVNWSHDDKQVVGGTTVVKIKFKNRNGNLYKLTHSDKLVCHIKHKETSTEISHAVEPSTLVGSDEATVSFTTRLSGQYTVQFKVSNGHLAGSSFTRKYLAGPLDSSKTVFLRFSNTIVLIAGIYHTIAIEAKDCFGNSAAVDQSKLDIEIRKNSHNGAMVNPEFFADMNAAAKYNLFLKVEQVGFYVGQIKYNNQRIGPPWFKLISLTAEDMSKVDKFIAKRSHNLWFEARMISDDHKAKKVYCYISPKQLQIKEYMKLLLLYIPKRRLFASRVCPLTTFEFCEGDTFKIDDGYRPPITLSSKDRLIIAATFSKYILRNVGGSEKFQDKQSYFYKEVCQLSKSTREERTIEIRRTNLLEDAIKITENFKFSDWRKKFVIKFRGEEGLDWGGVRREFFELLSVKCFNCSNKLFHRFKDDHQTLVLPNQCKVSGLKLKYYKFAGCLVGKCLYESAVSSPLLVKARFARSFLAQIIGLKVNYKYLESDDPELYKTKVCYIKDNDVTGLGQVFAEEEYTDSRSEPQMIPLIPNGQNIEVTNENKMRYLNLLAEYRLCNRIEDEMHSFLEGLNSIIPDELLSIFDETELELLICGTSNFNFDELKSHTAVNGAGSSFNKVISWFWAIISNFTHEEMARLLQFTTGCSQLPPGGFKDLTPNFQISPAPTHGQLPTAHTCFNQLCLPDYDSYEQFQHCLMLAINEGSEGFGFA